MTSNDTLAMTSIPFHAIASVDTITPKATLTKATIATHAIAPKASLAIRLHSSNLTEWSPATNRSIWPKTTRHTKSWVAINIVKDVHGVCKLDSIGSKAELLLAEPRV